MFDSEKIKPIMTKCVIVTQRIHLTKFYDRKTSYQK